MPPASCGTVPSPVAPRERLNRTKHTLGVGDAEFDRALSDGGLSHSDIDFVAITSAQSVELLTGLIDSFDILLTPHPDDTTLSVISQRVKLTPDQISARQRFSVRPALTTISVQRYSAVSFPKGPRSIGNRSIRLVGSTITPPPPIGFPSSVSMDWLTSRLNASTICAMDFIYR